MNIDELAEIIDEAAKEKDGVKQLACARAFRMAEECPFTLKEIGDACNRLGVKIVQCQLGCFE